MKHREYEKQLSEQQAELDKLRQEVAELKQSNQDLEHFAYVASHDLQAPLRTMEGYLSIVYKLVGEKEGNTEIASHFEHIFASVKRLQQLIHDLLEYSRAGRMEERQRVKCLPMLEIVKYNLRYDLEGKDVKIQIVAMPEQIMGHRMGITQLFQNLLSNAINFAKEGEANNILIQGQERETDWLFSVQDEGVGIEAKNFQRIFELFTRLQARQKDDKGTGIGLALCKRIVESHHGKIWVESELGKGSCFYFTIRKDHQEVV